MTPIASQTTGSTETVEAHIRYAARAFEAAGIGFRPTRMAKFIRATHRRSGPTAIREAIDQFVADEVHARTWDGFELFVLGSYADPTGATAAQHLDQRGAADLIRQRYAAKTRRPHRGSSSARADITPSGG